MFNIKLLAGIVALAAVTTSGSFVVGSKRGYDKGYAIAQQQCDIEKLNKRIEEQVVEQERLRAALESAEAVTASINEAAKRARQLDRKIEELNEQAVEFTSRPECKLSPSELHAIQSAYRVRDSDGADEVSDRKG